MKQIDMNESNHVESEALRKCITFACEHDLQNMQNGKYEIMGEQIYAVVSEYQTSPSEERLWEAHREYVDLQVVIRGEEVIEVSPLSQMICKDYIEKSVTTLSNTQNQFEYHVEVAKERGGEFRKINVEFIIVDAFPVK
jgi:YhcH/YjgK/YiaL family protein